MGYALIMTARPFINVARYAATIVGILLIAMVLVVWRQGTLDVADTVKSTLLNTETSLRNWFSSLHFH